VNDGTALELSAKADEHGVCRTEIPKFIERNSTVANSTPDRRAATVLAWLRWLQAATGAIQERQQQFSLR
jgi:hypothetical protein